MGTSMDLELSVALFAGMAAAMIVSPVRRSVPRWMEVLIWLGLIVACWLVVTHLKEAKVRFLTESAAWGAGQIVNTSIGLMVAGLLAWMSENRFVIANAVVMLTGADVLLLAMLRSRRQAEERQPRILLGEWIEFPLHRTPAAAPVAVPYAVDEWNRRAERAAAMLGAAFLTWFTHLLIWTRDVVIPQARARQAQVVAAGRVQLAARLEPLRERAIQLHVAAFGEAGRALTDDQVTNLRALLSAQSIGWYGPIMPAPTGVAWDREEGQEHESDRLAS
jgi:hypothetical protein